MMSTGAQAARMKRRLLRCNRKGREQSDIDCREREMGSYPAHAVRNVSRFAECSCYLARSRISKHSTSRRRVRTRGRRRPPARTLAQHDIPSTVREQNHERHDYEN